MWPKERWPEGFWLIELEDGAMKGRMGTCRTTRTRLCTGGRMQRKGPGCARASCTHAMGSRLQWRTLPAEFHCMTLDVLTLRALSGPYWTSPARYGCRCAARDELAKDTVRSLSQLADAIARQEQSKGFVRTSKSACQDSNHMGLFTLPSLWLYRRINIGNCPLAIR